MTLTFYRLDAPKGEAEPLYGQTEWAKHYGRAEWAPCVKLTQIVCPVDPRHLRSGGREGELRLVLNRGAIGDFIWTWMGDCVVTERVVDVFRANGLCGFNLKPAIVDRVKGKRAAATSIPTLYEVQVKASVDADPSSEVRLIKHCQACGLRRYSSYSSGLRIDPQTWDGSDIVLFKPYPTHILVTEKVKELIVRHQFTNCTLTPVHRVQWPNGVIRPEDSAATRSL